MLLRQLPRYVGGIENAARPTVHTNDSLTRHENGAFRKRASNRRNLKTPAFRFLVGQKTFENNDVTIIGSFGLDYECEIEQ